MSRSAFAGMTSYRHQSFEDMREDLHNWLASLNEVLEFLNETTESLKKSGYWGKTVTYDLAGLFGYSIKFYETSIKEITEILEGISAEVELHHITRLRSLGESATKLNHRFGNVWHRGDVREDYGNPEFTMIERMYAEGRDMAIDMMDLINLAVRLEEFVGRKGKTDSTETITKLIADGESEILEFKVAACWNAHKKTQDSMMSENISKAVASFMNREKESVLLIGVTDDGKIAGLADDYKVADPHKQNRDGYELFLRNTLGDTLGNDTSPFYDIMFHRIQEQDICQITVRPASKPIYFKDAIYIRNGNQNRKLSTKQAVEYVNQRWG